jgi:hypothetical protein
MKITIILSVITFQAITYSCAIFNIKSGGKIEKSAISEVEFCELTNFNNKLIKTNLEYSGFEEYWGASGYKDCKLNNNVSLNFEEYYDTWKHLLFDKRINRLNKNYNIKKAKMTVVGIFENSKPDTISIPNSSAIIINGFGHLGSNSAQITIKSFKMKLINM